MTDVAFGLRLAEFPLDGSKGYEFRDRLFGYIDAAHEHFASAWVADHFFPWMSSVDQSIDTFEGMTTIAYLAARYPKLLLGSIVLSQGYRSPALLAKMSSTLQALSGGRFVLGLGAGWKENEYRAFGYDYPSTGERLDQLAEAVQVIRKMWSDDSPTFHGKYYTIENAYNFPRTAPIPLMIGGGGRKKTLRITAQYADWWNIPGATPEEYASLLDTLREHCRVVGRNYDEIKKTWLTDCLAIAPSRAEADRLAHASSLCGGGAIIGDPDEVASQIQTLVDLGCSHFMLRFADFPKSDGALLFAREVMPRFR